MNGQHSQVNHNQNIHRSSTINCDCSECRTANVSKIALNYANNIKSESKPNMPNKNNDTSLLFQLQQQQQQKCNQLQQHQKLASTSQNVTYCPCQDCYQSLSNPNNKQQQLTSSSNYYMKPANQLIQQQHSHNHTHGQQLLVNSIQEYNYQSLNATKGLDNSELHEKYLNKVLSKSNPTSVTLSTSYQNSLANFNSNSNNTNTQEMLVKSKSNTNFNNQMMMPSHLISSEYNELVSNGLPIKKLKNDLYPISHSLMNTVSADYFRNSSNQQSIVQNIQKQQNRKLTNADISMSPFQSVPSKADLLNNSASEMSKFPLFYIHYLIF